MQFGPLLIWMTSRTALPVALDSCATMRSAIIQVKSRGTALGDIAADSTQFSTGGHVPVSWVMLRLPRSVERGMRFTAMIRVVIIREEGMRCDQSYMVCMVPAALLAVRCH